MSNVIPKKIHYCWFGGNPLPELAKKCIASWKKYCPDYEIVEWNESNYDINKNRYMKEAYEEKKWGFVPDYARLDIIYEHGGIYLDTDVELLKSLDELLNNKVFMGLERAGVVALGLGFGAEKENSLIYELRQQYEELHFINSEGKPNLTPAPALQSDFLKAFGLTAKDELQEIMDRCYIYPKEYFCPIDMDTGRLLITENTYSIHHYAASWESKINIFRGEVYRFLNRHFGKKVADDAKFIFGKKNKKNS